MSTGVKASEMTAAKKAYNPWQVLWVTSSATAMVFLDNTVMPVALPTIEKELALSQNMLIWVVNAYLLTMLTLMLIGGRLCDLWGMRKTYRWGLILFGTGSLLAGLSFNSAWLIIGRIVQGMGGALVIPTTGALIMDTFPLGKRAKAIGINTGIGSLFLIAGPAIGGFFTEYWNWRAIFWINVPVVAYTFYMSHKRIPTTVKKDETFHLLGALPLAFSVIALVVALMQGSAWGWGSLETLFFFAASPVFFLLFLWASKHAKHPIIDFSIFRVPQFPAATFCIFLTQFFVMATVLWAIYFQQELNFEALEAGLMILIATTPVAIISPIAGIIADRFGPRLPVSLGFLLVIFSLTWFVVFPGNSQITRMLPGLLPFGCGIPLIMSPSFAAALSSIPPAKLGAASAMTTTLRQLASTLGIALMTAIFYGVANVKGYVAGFSAISLFAALIGFGGLLFTLIFLRGRKH